MKLLSKFELFLGVVCVSCFFCFCPLNKEFGVAIRVYKFMVCLFLLNFLNIFGVCFTFHDCKDVCVCVFLLIDPLV